ncbi:response regulator [Magnetococcus sp. PR-3]|uniref:response regulator n=1 Tax=Magnetococcus sp. PR-3 TaxID=3120355 RepID=UPI002FCE09FC
MDTILLASHDQRAFQRLKSACQDQGYELVGACHVLDVIHHAQLGTVGALIIDLRLPDMLGWGMLRSVRASGISLPIITLVGADPGFDRNLLFSMACQAGADMAVQAHTQSQQLATWVVDAIHAQGDGADAEGHSALDVTHNRLNPLVYECVRKPAKVMAKV